MIGDLTAGIAVDYPGADTEGMTDAVKVTLTEEVGKHTLLEATHYGAPTYFANSLHTGSPMRLITATRYGTRSWPGYVIDPRPALVTSSTVPATVVQGLGMTYHAKQTSTKVWSAGTISEYMREIAYGLGMVPYIESSDIRQTVPQAGRSNWELLRDLAAMASLNLFATGTTLNALTPKGALGAFWEEAPYLRFQDPSGPQDWPDALTVCSYGRKDLSRTAIQATGIDPVTGRTITTTAGDGLYTDYTSVTARSLSSLKAKAVGAAQPGRYAFTAFVKGPGNILVGAGRPVYLEDRGDGKWWIVTKVVHEFSAALGIFTTSAWLWRDSSLPETPAASAAPGRTTARTLTDYCLCREYDPLLVSAQRASYITKQNDAPGTEQTYQTSQEVARWLNTSPQWPTVETPKTMEIDLRRWRARGRCDWA